MPARIHVTPIPRTLTFNKSNCSFLKKPETLSYAPTPFKLTTKLLSQSIDFALMEVDGGYSMTEEGCQTPKQRGCMITATCPPAPRKKQACLKLRNPPENGYFQPPDLEIVFAMPPRREACV